jgi:hypothetical protein
MIVYVLNHSWDYHMSLLEDGIYIFRAQVIMVTVTIPAPKQSAQLQYYYFQFS